MAENAKKETLYTRFVYITFVIALYWTVSITMVFINKYLLSDPDVKLDAPFFITWFQCVVTYILCFILAKLTLVFPWIAFPDFKLQKETLKSVFPLSLLFVAMISFNNLSLKYLDVSFYFVGRSLTTVFNVIFSYTILHQKTSLSAVACCAIIISGYFLGIDQENVAGSLSPIGIICGVLASLSVCLFSIYTKKVLPAVNNSSLAITYYTNFLALFLFIPLIALNSEIGAFRSTNITVFFWGCLVVSGIFGLAIGYVSSLQINVTSPLTHNISGTAKACAQTILAVIWFQEFKPWLWWLSNGLVLFGSAAYTRVKQLEMIQKFNSGLSSKV